MAFVNQRTLTMKRKSKEKTSEKPKGRMRVAPPRTHFKSLRIGCLQEIKADGTARHLSQEGSQKGSNAAAETKDEPLKIDKMCSIYFVERVGASVFIGMDFVGGGSLKVEVEGDSITNIYSTNGKGYNPNPSLGTVSSILTEFLMNYKVTEFKKDSTTVNGVTYDQQLVFTRDDGNHLTIFLSPNAIKKIEYG